MQRRNLLALRIATGTVLADAPPAALAATATPPLPVHHRMNVFGVDPIALRGKVSLVNVWTYSCINAQRTLPHLRRWKEEYGALGLRATGIHTSEFAFEHLRANVQHAVLKAGVRFPVGQDNGYRTWRALQSRAWPSFYPVDRDERLRAAVEGEGHAVEVGRAIHGMLGLSSEIAPRQPPADADLSNIRIPEVYLGALRQTPQEPGQPPRSGTTTYAFSRAGPRLVRYELDGVWPRKNEALVLRSSRGGLRMRYSAAKLHLVAAASAPVQLHVGRGDATSPNIRVDRPALYTVVDGTTCGEKLIEIQVMSAGTALHSVTFG
jgi:thiol-disulfide isomerase/thioredoxin